MKPEAGAVGGEDLRVLALVDGLQRVDVGRRGGDVLSTQIPAPPARDADDREDQGEHEQDLLADRAACVRPLTSALACGHWDRKG